MSRVVGRRSVPLKKRCSRKWAVPATSRVSYRDPAPTKSMADIEPVPPGTVSTVRPLSRVEISAAVTVGSRIPAARRGARLPGRRPRRDNAGMASSNKDAVRSARAVPPSGQAWLLAALALITPLGLILVNVAAYVMAHLAAFRVAVTASAVVSTVILNGIAAIAAYRYGVARWPEWSTATGPQPLVPRLAVWLFSPPRRRAVMVEAAYILLMAAVIAGEL